MVLANRLKPERLDADRAAADLRVPDEEPRSEGLAADVGPAGRVDEEAEHVLLPAVQAGRPVEALGRGLKFDGELLHHGQQVGVVEPRVAGGVDRAELLALGEQLQGLVAPRQGFAEDPCRRIGRKPIDGLLGHARQAAKLAETPIVHLERLVLAGRQNQPVRADRPGAQSVFGGCQSSTVCCFCHWQCCESTDSDGKHSSGVRRKSSLDARVRLLMT